MRQVRNKLLDMGFNVMPGGKYVLLISSSKNHFEKIFLIKLKTIEKKIKPIKEYAPFESLEREFSYQAEGPIKIPDELQGLVEKIELPKPAYSLALATPPQVDYYHLCVPDQIRELYKLPRLGSDSPLLDHNGDGVKVVMIDTGFYRHPYFEHYGYPQVQVVIPESDFWTQPDSELEVPSTIDGFGHGTCMVANILAIAPKIDLTMIGTGSLNPSSATINLALGKALENEPDIISCSWKTSYDEGVEGMLEKAIDRGIKVLVGCGNKIDDQNSNQPTWPGDMPEVISVGGVYPNESGGLIASSYACSGPSTTRNRDDDLIYPNRLVPDVCGIVGQEPDGILIMLPIEPSCGGDYYFGPLFGEPDDGTSNDDGWACLSGTSSATAQVAGVVALMLQINPSLTISEVKEILGTTAIDVTSGESATIIPNSGNQHYKAVPKSNLHPDYATGYGFVDAQEAILETKKRLQ